MLSANPVLHKGCVVARGVTALLRGGLTRSRFGRVVHRKSGCEQRLCYAKRQRTRATAKLRAFQKTTSALNDQWVYVRHSERIFVYPVKRHRAVSKVRCMLCFIPSVKLLVPRTKLTELSELGNKVQKRSVWK